MHIRRNTALRLGHVLFVYLGQSKENFALGHRADGHMSALISPLKGIINAFFNGQLTLAAH